MSWMLKLWTPLMLSGAFNYGALQLPNQVYCVLKWNNSRLKPFYRFSYIFFCCAYNANATIFVFLLKMLTNNSWKSHDDVANSKQKVARRDASRQKKWHVEIRRSTALILGKYQSQSYWTAVAFCPLTSHEVQV